MSLSDFYAKIEERFNVKYPLNENATYSSDMNYSLENDTFYQRWYRYKEGFSMSMVKNLIEKYNKYSDGIILDPFMGSGSTLLTASLLGLKSIGFEINPFSYFLAYCKLQNYTDEEISEFHKIIENLKSADVLNLKYQLPALSFANKVFSENVENYYMKLRTYIENMECKSKIKNLLRLGWLSNLERESNYRKAGNGLKVKKYKKPIKITNEKIMSELVSIYLSMFEDLTNVKFDKDALLINDSCLNMRQYIDDDSISGVIFSPPYANCFDYTEIYKLELWFGNFVKSYDDLKKLRKKSLRSNLSSDLKNTTNYITSDLLEKLLSQLDVAQLWDKNIPTMLRLYFSDMFNNIKDCYSVLKEKGFCCIVVGNSSYGGIVFPTDLLLADYAKSIGFEVDSIDVGRYIITSSQQYNKTKEIKKYLRESIICLIKK